jgi:hypothetical protein
LISGSNASFVIIPENIIIQLPFYDKEGKKTHEDKLQIALSSIARFFLTVLHSQSDGKAHSDEFIAIKTIFRPQLKLLISIRMKTGKKVSTFGRLLLIHPRYQASGFVISRLDLKKLHHMIYGFSERFFHFSSCIMKFPSIHKVGKVLQSERLNFGIFSFAPTQAEFHHLSGKIFASLPKLQMEKYGNERSLGLNIP